VSAGRRYLGMREGDLDGKPYAKFWQPEMQPLSTAARTALANSPASPAGIPPLSDAPRLDGRRSTALEDGYAIGQDGVLHVAIRTPMPGTSPAMVDWWFGWHSDEPQRYKLWHPRAHVHAEWKTRGAAGLRGRERYVGRVSLVDEYLGGTLGHYSIRFIAPAELGFDAAALADPEAATAVCARVGFARVPFDFGYLVHHVRRTPEGAEMCSRFWVGAPFAAPRGGGAVGRLAVRVVKGLRTPRAREGAALLRHCSEEMPHLASFLPRIHAELGGD
jgi:DAPG hydrolase PhiG domain